MTPRAPIEYPKCEACKDHGGTAYCPRCVGKAIDSATKALREEIDAAKNLLAVLHRDGGHHTDEVGFIQSCKDGEQVRHELLARADRAETAIKPLVEALKAILAERYGCAFCDSGKLRNPAKGHDLDCGFELARAALAAHEESKK